MPKTPFACAVALVIAGLALMPAHAADIDQRCLNLCIRNGGSSATCLDQCTYGKTNAPAAARIPGTSHNVLDAPQPISTVILNRPQQAKPTTDKDYACVNECLKQGEQYAQCNTSCMKTTCPPGDNRCKDLLGKAPAAASLTTTTTN